MKIHLYALFLVLPTAVYAQAPPSAPTRAPGAAYAAPGAPSNAAQQRIQPESSYAPAPSAAQARAPGTAYSPTGAALPGNPQGASAYPAAPPLARATPAAAGAPNPFAKPVPGAAAHAPVNSSANPYGQGPQPPPTGYGQMPGVNGFPSRAGPAEVPEAVDPGTRQEDVTAVRIGVVNGQHIYRGTNTYLFQEAKTHPVVRTLAKVVAPAPGVSATPAAAKPASPSAPSPSARPAQIGGRAATPAPRSAIPAPATSRRAAPPSPSTVPSSRASAN